MTLISVIRSRSLTAAVAVGVALFFCARPALAVEIIRDTEIEKTLKTFAKPLLDQAGIPPDNVNIVIVKNEDINAFVAGGMNIFINTGLLFDTREVGELTGVMAHEISHIASGHLLRLKDDMEHASMQTVLSTLLGIAAAVGTGKSEAAVAISTGGRSMAMRRFLSHSREHESAADQGAVGYLAGAGLSPRGMLGFLDRMTSQEYLPESQQMEYVRTHPLSYDRVSFLRYVVQNSKLTATPPPSGWDELYRTMIAKLTAYLMPERAFQDYAGTTPLDQYAQAIAHYRKHNFSRAIALCNKLLTAYPENPYYHELKGQILFDSGNIIDAIIPYRKAVTLAPEATQIRVALAHALLESRIKDPALLKEAIDNLGRALQKEPKMGWAHRLMATAYGRKNDEPMAQLHLAEEALLQNRLADAEKLATLAQQKLPKTSAASAWARSRDILNYVQRAQKKKTNGRG